MRLPRLLPALAVVALAVGLAACGGSADSPVSANPAATPPPLAAELVAVTGEPVSLAALRGKPVLIEVFSFS